MRIGQQPLDRRIEKTFDLVYGHVSSRQDAGEQFVDAMALGDRKRMSLSPGIKAVAPGEARQ